MKKPAIIDIPKPCNEDWHKMTPQEQGRFCSSCQKCVVDFTQMSDRAVYEYMWARRGERICGKIYSSQLHRPITIPHQPQSKLYKWMIAAGLVLCFTQIPDANAKAFNYPIEQIVYANQQKGDSAINAEDSVVIRGTVVDENGEPVIGAVVELNKGDSCIGGDITNVKGSFGITAKTNINELGDVNLEINSVGYEKQLIVLTNENIAIHHNIQLRIGAYLGLIEIIEVEYKVPLIHPFKTSTIITSDQIERMPH